MLSYRETQILDILKERKYAKIEEIAKQIYVSEATVPFSLKIVKKFTSLCVKNKIRLRS